MEPQPTNLISSRRSRYVTLTSSRHPSIPNPVSYFHTTHFRIAFLDSRPELPVNSTQFTPSAIAVMFVPPNRENDWIFTTEAGHTQLLYARPEFFERLILIGNAPTDELSTGVCITNPAWSSGLNYKAEMKSRLGSFLGKMNIGVGVETRFLDYKDPAVKGRVLERVFGPVVGEFLVEDVQYPMGIYRKLRYKRTPCTVQAQIKIAGTCIQVRSPPDLKVLVDREVTRMVASLVLLGGCLDSRTPPRALCVGIRGGVLLRYLENPLGFVVTGVEADREVLRVAREYFGLEGPVSVQDGIEFLKDQACKKIKYDVIMVDLDRRDFGMGASVPPFEFMQESVLLEARNCLSGAGILVLKVIAIDELVYEDMKKKLRRVFVELYEKKRVFVELYEIDSGIGLNHIVAATMAKIDVLDNPGILQSLKKI